MAFLKNDSDIILDAVLTDVGRERLADGTFKVAKFSLGDDEINYELYDSAAGTAYADLNILKTPIMEALTNSKASLKHPLLTLDNPNHLYLPVLKLNSNASNASAPGQQMANSAVNPNRYVVMCTKTSYEAYQTLPQGFLPGHDTTLAAKQPIFVEHGLDSAVAGSQTFADALAAELTETGFHVYVDERFGRVATPGTGEYANDISADVTIAHYLLNGGNYFAPISNATTNADASVVAGPRAANKFQISLMAATQLINSTFNFTKFGNTVTNFFTTSGGALKAGSTLTDALVIDTTIRIIGNKTGISVDIPVRFAREP